MLILTAEPSALHSFAASPAAMALFGAFLTFMATWGWTRAGREYTETREQKKARDESEIKWKEGRLAAEQGLRDAINAERQTRVEGGLKTESDIARITDLLSRFVVVQDKIATMAERVEWHGKQLERHEGGFKEIHDQLHGIGQEIKDIIRDAKRSDAR